MSRSVLFHTCRVCKGTVRTDRPYLRTGIRHYVHWECKFTSMTDEQRREFMRSLPLWVLETSPAMYLHKLRLFEFCEELIEEKRTAKATRGHQHG